MNKVDSHYDAAIIGAGIGGLVCGCYLAKSGLKVVIAEMGDKPGGYCTSFKRKGYTFDIGVHYLGSLRKNEGILHNILNELGICDNLELLSSDICDRIVTPDATIRLHSDIAATRNELTSLFPKEKKQIARFFDFVTKTDLLSLVAKTKKLTFLELLDCYFKDKKLVFLLSVPLGNLGLAPSKASALVSCILFREYVFDGGYYPRGGILKFPELLASKFVAYGGTLLFNCRVSSIATSSTGVTGITLTDGAFIRSKIVVSNADARTTFAELIRTKTKELTSVKRLIPSSSAFLVYFALKQSIQPLVKEKHFVTWFFPKRSILPFSKGHSAVDDHLICHFPSLIDSSLAPRNKDIARAMLFTPPSQKVLTEKRRKYLYDKVMENMEKIAPGFTSTIEFSIVATPSTFQKFTANWGGSIFGWTSTVDQLDRSVFPSETSVNGLYLSGHWVTNGIGQSGVPLVAFCGMNTARLILRQYTKPR